MISQFGNGIKPYLNDLWVKSNQLLDRVFSGEEVTAIDLSKKKYKYTAKDIEFQGSSPRKAKEVEQRLQKSHGKPLITMGEKFKVFTVDSWHKITREYQYLPKYIKAGEWDLTLPSGKVHKFGPYNLRNELLKLQKQEAIGKAYSVGALKKIKGKLDPTQWKLLERVVLFSDLTFDIKESRGLPFIVGLADRAGSIGHKLVAGMHQAMAALSIAGNNVIADHVLVEPDWLRQCIDLLSPLPAFFVGVRCPLAVLEQRERERSNRTWGQARAQVVRVNAHGIYDLEVDTSIFSPEDCAQQIKVRLDSGNPPDAFKRLKHRKLANAPRSGEVRIKPLT